LPPTVTSGILAGVSAASIPIRLGPQGRLVVPVELRRELSLDEGSELTIRSDGHRLILEPRAEVLRRLRNRFRHLTDAGVSLADELLEDRREEARRDAR
jgi:bifunctional DNA-binding transcriptional regulator/antitoxin component of YhaV-PrlF toxin-antitoxin module